jgi:hypothetical protein
MGSHFGPQCDPLVFYVFYLRKYFHGFSHFNDIVIQLFQKTSVMTVATLVMINNDRQYTIRHEFLQLNYITNQSSPLQ